MLTDSQRVDAVRARGAGVRGSATIIIKKVKLEEDGDDVLVVVLIVVDVVVVVVIVVVSEYFISDSYSVYIPLCPGTGL